MRFYTVEECKGWLVDRHRVLPDEVRDCGTERVAYPRQVGRYFYIARWIASNVASREPSLLWMKEWGIWSSSENWHLYYRLRQSHGDYRLLHEAPGHLLLDYETEDLSSYLQLAMLNGWGGYLLTAANQINLFFSHDEFIDFYSNQPGLLNAVKQHVADH